MEAHYLQILKRTLTDRARRNPQYSLRAYARDLGMTPSRVSQILNGRLGLSGKAALQLSHKLDLSESESERFYNSVQSRYARNPHEKAMAAERLKKTESDSEVETIRLDTFNIISDWYHYALLELLETEDSKSDSKWLAAKLKISVSDANAAVERLIRVGLLRRSARGKLKVLKNKTMTPTDIPSAAIRAFHESLLRKSVLALDAQSIEERDFSSSILAIAKSDLPALKKELREFRRSLLVKYAKKKSKDAVYALTVQLFKLSEAL